MEIVAIWAVSTLAAGIAGWFNRYAGLAVIGVVLVLGFPIIALTNFSIKAVALFAVPASIGFLMGDGIRRRRENLG
tara:strand:+ start:2286 stop:2513 length:228 start_codon:yes stop_codon:yes gene_type:complete